MRIGFLGLGNMGRPMARNLLGAGHTVTVYNRTPGKANTLTTLGAREATSLADAVKDAEVVITMLSGDTALKEIVHGPTGLIQNLPPKSIHLCMCTIEVDTSTALASAHAQAGQGYVAAPIFGRADTPESSHIWILAGGPEPQVNRCRPIFEALGRGYTRVGPNAALAHALKLGGNLLTIAMELAVSEILTYAKQAGLPPADFLRFLNTAIFRSHMVHDYGGAMNRPSFDPEDKTLDLAANEMLFQTAKDMGATIPVEDMLNARLQAAAARGWGKQDLAELSQTCRLETGLEGTPDPAPIAVPAPVPIPEPKTGLPNPPVSKPTRRPARESKRATDSKGIKPEEEQTPQSMSPQADNVARTIPSPEGSTEPAGPPQTSQTVPSNTFPAMEGGTPIPLDLYQTSHFEMIGGRVWAWSQGRCYKTHWNMLSDVEVAFNHVLFLLIKRHILLRPDAVLDIRSTFGGGAKARVSDDMELDVSRSAAPRLKELLGI